MRRAGDRHGTARGGIEVDVASRDAGLVEASHVPAKASDERAGLAELIPRVLPALRPLVRPSVHRVLTDTGLEARDAPRERLDVRDCIERDSDVRREQARRRAVDRLSTKGHG